MTFVIVHEEIFHVEGKIRVWTTSFRVGATGRAKSRRRGQLEGPGEGKVRLWPQEQEGIKTRGLSECLLVLPIQSLIHFFF